MQPEIVILWGPSGSLQRGQGKLRTVLGGTLLSLAESLLPSLHSDFLRAFKDKENERSKLMLMVRRKLCRAWVESCWNHKNEILESVSTQSNITDQSLNRISAFLWTFHFCCCMSCIQFPEQMFLLNSSFQKLETASSLVERKPSLTAGL